jgi:GNAT superfamily N-acetyltransferase
MTPTRVRPSAAADPDARASIALIEAHLVEHSRLTLHLPGTELHDDPDVTWAVQPLGSAWANAGVRIRFTPETAPARLDALLDRYRANRRGMGLWVSPLATPADLPALLTARRLRCRHHFPAMLWTRSSATPPRTAPAGLRIQDITSLDDFGDRHHPAVGPPTTPFRRFAVARLAALHALPGRPVRSLIAWLDGEPVGSAEMFVGTSCAGLHGLGVAERCQGRGIGSALVDRVCAIATDAGRDQVALLATTKGERVYASRGFVEVARFGYYYRSFQQGRR